MCKMVYWNRLVMVQFGSDGFYVWEWLAWVQAAVLSCPSFACSSWMRSCLASYSYRSTSVRPTKVSRSRASTCLSISARTSARICSRSSTGRTRGRSGWFFDTQANVRCPEVCHNRVAMFDRVHTVFPEHLPLWAGLRRQSVDVSGGGLAIF